MKTRNTLIVGVLAVAFLNAPLALFADTPGTDAGNAIPAATTNNPMDQQIQMMRQDIRDKRRQIVAANLPLTTDESAKFWPLYDQYIVEVTKINDARFARIKNYAANYATLTDDQAVDYVTKLFNEDKAMIDLRVKYLAIFEKVLSNKKSAMFLQIDRRIQMMIDIQRASMIPLINPK